MQAMYKAVKNYIEVLKLRQSSLLTFIGVWLPLHVWSIMIANRQDYLSAGLSYFLMSREVREAVKVLLVFSLVLYATSVALYFIGGFAWLYLVLANLLGITMVHAVSQLVISSAS